MTTEQEALTIAQNYLSLVLVNEGDWGGFDAAEVAAVQEFTRGERTLGYFCQVYRRGFLVISLHKELAPVKAYSVWSDLDPEADEGLTDLLKDRIERVFDAIEEKLGREIEPDDKLDDLLEINYRAASEVLAAKSFDPQDYQEPQRARAAGMDYQEGEILLTSRWHQKPPYNNDCPDHGCTWPDHGFFNTNAKVGCVATAGAQIMRYWCWPPYGAGGSPYDDTYDWPNMCGEYNWHDDSGWFNDENGVPVTWDQINAAAELGREIGRAADMDYGCDSSSTPTHNMEGVYESHYRYSTSCYVDYRDDYDDPVDWFEVIKGEFNMNRPVQYRIPGHSMVGDGWKEEWIGDDYYWYHMNYGHRRDSEDIWYALDELAGGDPDDEYLIKRIVPVQAIGSDIAGSYPLPSFPYRYFDQDASGSNATFDSGQLLQILKGGFVLRSIGSASESVTFCGSPSANTRFFLYGDPDTQIRIRISGGGLSLYGGGEMVIH